MTILSQSPSTKLFTKRKLAVAITIGITLITIATLLRTYPTQTLKQQQQQQRHSRRLSALPTHPHQKQHDERDHRQLARAFPTWESKFPNESWCITEKRKGHAGLIYVKSFKTGSSTAAGIALRIGRRRSPPGELCLVERTHRPGWLYRVRNEQSFVFSSVRDPTNRALSHVFFKYVTKLGDRPRDAFVIEKLRELSWPQKGWHHVREYIGEHGEIEDYKKWVGFQVAYLSMGDPEQLVMDNTKDPKTHEKELVKAIIRDYDFLMVAERMDESLVALMFLLGVNIGDILYVGSKVAGSSYRYDDFTKSCQKLAKPYASPAVMEYLSSEEWHSRISGDVLLHTAANRCLDATIEGIGLERFTRALEEYRAAMKVAEETCPDTVIWPCTDEGPDLERSAHDCEWRDQGCGLRCLDMLAATL